MVATIKKEIDILELRRCNDLAAVVEDNADATVAQKVAETVFLAIINPLRDPM